MSPRAYYNEFDPHAAAWLRELIRAGLIMDGVVDERSIADVRPDDLVGFTRVHLFAGIGGWDYALRLAGWPDDRPVWTGSCPCPPFSSAGKKKNCPQCQSRFVLPHPRKTGVFACAQCAFEWLADGRHLWPEFLRLASVGQPPAILGEQVASADGRIWLAGVRATLEYVGYVCGAADLAAAGIGSPHIRQRLFWLAHSASRGQRIDGCTPRSSGHVDECGEASWLAVSEGERHDGTSTAPESAGRNGPEGRCTVGRVGNSLVSRLEGLSGHGDGRRESGWLASQPVRPTAAPSGSGHWSRFDLIPCRDGKARRVESGTFPLAHGVPARVGRLRGYGNAIVPQVAAEFIRAYLDVTTDTLEGTR